MNNRLNRISFCTLRHTEYDLIRNYCESERQITWAIGDMWYDWKRFVAMKKDDAFILKIHKGGTHIFTEDKVKDYVGHLNPSIYFKVTCHENREGKEDWEGESWTIEPYDVKEGD